MEVDRKTNDEENEPTIVEVIKETAILPARILLSKQALRTYLSTILLVLTALGLYGISVTAYAYFYYNYIPNLNFSAPIHLQFDHPTTDIYTREPSYNPHGLATITWPSGTSSVLVSQQKYDFTIKLSLPRTPTNKHAGNFMVTLSLLGPSSKMVTPPFAPASQLLVQRPNSTTIAISSRPTSLKYISPPVEIAKKVFQLPSYILGWRHETEVLSVQMMEGISFERGWRNIPSAVWVEVRSTERLQIYCCEVKIKATLSGIRWLMYNHRIFAFMALTSLFWTIEMTTALFIWLLASFVFSGDGKPAQKLAIKVEKAPVQPVKREAAEDDDADNMSDTERTFPTYAGQPMLRYTSPQRPHIKIEEEIGEGAGRTPTGDADVSASDPSDEDADFVMDELEGSTRRWDYDSGLGTSMDSGAGSSSTSRRRRTSGK